MHDLPTGTVTFLFTDVEGSTRLLYDLGDAAYSAALADHRRRLRDAFERHAGVEVDTQGDAFFVAFRTAAGALAAAAEAQEALAGAPISVRIGIHTGTPLLGDEGYVGPDVHRAARIAAAGYGGQVLVSASTAALAGMERLRDLGSHRLKDLAAAERIYQLGDDEFPPLRSLYQTNLPVPLTPFLGRERELAELATIVSRDDVRLVTLTGPGGTGKTRLALQAAAVAADAFPDGVWWVPLAPLRDPTLVLSSASQAIGSRGDLATHIADRSMVLLFDNFEQVLAAATDVAELLERCPRLTAMVTSRERLRLTGEHEYPVAPFAEQDAVEFFLTRARAVQPDFDADPAVTEICRRLDDLPLALELAAAWVRVLTASQILERLSRRLPLLTGGARDLPERQQTLDATIAWSHELLSEGESRLFAQLSVFRGGCSLDAAEAVADADLATLVSLADKSLVRHRVDRFSMLETIRDFAAARLEASSEADELRRRHAGYFMALAREAEPDLLAGHIEPWLDRLEADHDNLRAALDRLEASGATGQALAMAGALTRFWYLHGHLAEGRRRLEPALRVDAGPTVGRAKALNGLALLAIDSGEPGLMKRYAQEAVSIFRQLGDGWWVANSLQLLGHATIDEGDVRAGRQLLEESAETYSGVTAVYSSLMSKHGVAFASAELGEVSRARELYEHNLQVAREVDLPRVEARALAQLALLTAEEGRIEEALSMLHDAYGIDRRLGEAVELAIDLCRVARVLALAGRPTLAAGVLSSAEALRLELGAVFRPWAVKMNDATRSVIRNHIDEREFAAAWEEGRRLSPDEAVALAWPPHPASGT